MNGIGTVTIAAVSGVAGALIGIGVWSGTIGNEVQNQGQRIDRHAVRLERLELVLIDQRIALIDIKSDIRAIKDALVPP